MTRRAPDTATRAHHWRDNAACSGLGDLFVPRDEKSADANEARLICGRCPVRQECLDAAMKEEGQTDEYRRAGVRGGLTPAERAEMAARFPSDTPTAEDLKSRRQGPSRNVDMARTISATATSRARTLIRQGRLSDTAIARQVGLTRDTVAKLRRAIGVPTLWETRTPERALAERTRAVEDGHVVATGTSGQITLHRRVYTVAQLAFLIRHGRHADGHVRPACGREGCVAAEHLADRIMRTTKVSA